MQYLILLLLMAMGIIVLLSTTPAAQGDVPGRDSGVFLYIGQKMLDGQIPYRDIWDHKPPLIFFINALGFMISAHSFWGMWLLEVVFLTIALWAGYGALRALYPNWIALISMSFMVAQLPYILLGGNFTEFYVLAFQFGAIWIFVNRQSWHWLFAIGVLGGCAFLLRQNLIGVWVAIGLLLLWQGIRDKTWQRLGLQVSLLAFGAALPLLIIGLWFALHGALDDMWQAAFVYNFAYVGAGGGLAAQLDSVKVGLSIGLYRLLPVLWVVALVGVWKQTTPSDIARLALILFPIDLFLGTFSGQTYLHYYMVWQPLLVLLVATALDIIRHSPLYALMTRKIFANSRLTIAHYVGMIVGASIAAWLGLFVIAFFMLVNNTDNRPITRMYRAVDTFLADHAKADDTLLVWGGETYLHSFTGHGPISRYVYQYPLTRIGYADTAIVAEFFADLQTNRPMFIIDTHNPALPPLDSSLRANWDYEQGSAMLPELEGAVSWMVERYELLECIEDDETWCIYQLRRSD